ncbi:MAG: peptide chain release factor N(5)-glutamine methyltransferase [Clostridia bacterium]|nr:peptide chain release factor N(5)-glutamine methyltransferase [Clostridia bacterium]
MDLQALTARLRAANIENATGEARLLWETFQGEALKKALARRLTGYPLQYILGEWYFYREVYEVNESCLIPRADTEILVECAIKTLGNGARFLDLCTGSGCVAISTLAARPDTTAIAVDLFPETLALATRNAAKNHVENRFTTVKYDVLHAPATGIFSGKFDAILSNPPYISDSIIPTLQTEVSFEPLAALAGGTDGLDFYRAILRNWVTYLKPGGIILFEIGYDQAEALAGLAANAGFTCEIKKDYGGQDRVAILFPRA